MTDEESPPEQFVFRDGELVRGRRDPRGPGDGPAADRVEPGAASEFRLAVKPDALDANDALVEVVEAEGRTLAFGSRAGAEAYAARLSAGDGDLRVQAAAPNDPGEADAYLLAAHDPSVAEPAAVDGDTLTFDVGANLYGALGEAVLLHAPKPHALYCFVRRDLGVDDGDLERGLRIDVSPGTRVSASGRTSEWGNGSDEEAGKEAGEGAGDDPGDGTLAAADDRTSWVPDCEIVATDGWTGPELATYYAEIKTGNASFERSQVATMERLAADERVLKIRVLVDDLPEQYSVRIRDVDPPD